jgi:hypothetical protein
MRDVVLSLLTLVAFLLILTIVRCVRDATRRHSAVLLRLQRLGIQGLTAADAYADILAHPPGDPVDERNQLDLAAELFRDRASA